MCTVVDDHARLAPRLPHGLEDVLHRLDVREVAGDVEQGGRVLGRFLRAGDARDAVVGCQEGLGDGCADAGAGAEDQGDGSGGRHDSCEVWKVVGEGCGFVGRRDGGEWFVEETVDRDGSAMGMCSRYIPDFPSLQAGEDC